MEIAELARVETFNHQYELSILLAELVRGPRPNAAALSAMERGLASLKSAPVEKM